MDYTTEPEHVRFTLDGFKSPAGKLGVWRSHFKGVSESVDPGAYANASSNTSFLVREGDAALADSGFTVAVGRNEIVTVSTQVEGVPRVAPTLPASPPACPFPRTLADDFDAVAAGQEARYFQDMHGSFEAVKSSDASRGMVMRQMAVGQPIGFHGTDGPPLSVVGSQAVSTDGSVSADFLIEEAAEGAAAAAVLGSHITDAQCGHCGVYLTVGPNSWSIGPSVGGAGGSWANGTCEVSAGQWHSMKLNVTTGSAFGWVDGQKLFGPVEPKDQHGKPLDLSAQGWVGIGAGSFGGVLFDRFTMQQ